MKFLITLVIFFICFSFSLHSQADAPKAINQVDTNSIEDLANSYVLNQRVIAFQRVSLSLFAIIIGFGTWFFLESRKNTKLNLEQTKKIHEQEKEIEKEKFENLLAKREKELYANAKQLAKANQIIEKLQNDYNKLKDLKANSKSLDDYISDLSNEEGNEKSLEDFEYKFRELYPNFYKNLTIKVENLTKTELRICAFLKMKLSSKEISAIIHKSPTTIDKHRYNIRKKMNLEQDDNIFEKLQKY